MPKRTIDRYNKTIFEWKFSPMANYVCPTYKVTRNESNTPRGLALLLSLVRSNEARGFDPVLADRLYQCMSCYLCTAHAYDDSDPASLFIAARQDLAAEDRTPRSVMDHEARLSQALRKAGGAAALPNHRKKTAVGVVVDPFLTGAYLDKVRANIGLLEKAGIDYGVIGMEEGTGAQFIELGFMGTGKRIAEGLMEDVRKGGYRNLLFLSPYDYRAVKDWYREFLGTSLEGVQLTPFPSFLGELVEAGRLRFTRGGGSVVVTYHEPGHFVRPRESFSGIGRIVEKIEGVQYRPLWKNGRLAASDSGDFLFDAFPEIARAIDASLVKEAAAVQAEILLTSCFYSLRNLQSVNAAAGLKIEDLGQFLAERLA